MDKYKDYVARTQEERILLDMLCAIEKIAHQNDVNEMFDDTQLIEQKVVEEIIKDVKNETKQSQKRGRKKKEGDA